MAELYNLTNITTSDNIYTLTKNVNELTGDWLGFFILICFFLILFAAYRGYSAAVRATTASFITTIIAMLFRVMELTGDLIVLTFILIAVGSFLIMMYQN